MIKFWKEDFRYVERYEYGLDVYRYVFTVRGESANYLMNKYDLGYPNITVNLFTDDNSMSVASKANNGLQSDVTDIDDIDDLAELLKILSEKVYRFNKL